MEPDNNDAVVTTTTPTVVVEPPSHLPWQRLDGGDFSIVLMDQSIYGFVYLIENLVDGRKYVGKKLFWSKKTRQVKGKKKRYLAESDWQSYYGSSDELKNDIVQYGHQQFRRTILHLCRSKGECSYLELKEQIERNALLRDDYYNTWLSARIRRSHIKQLIIETNNGVND